MVVVIVLLTIAVFILIDLGLRVVLRNRERATLQREREQALDVGLRLEWTDEAASLKRVEVDAPRARILAVDDEPVVLDSFRRILVLEGYSIDTVETAQEALGLVRRNDYDFVFTDLKMPGMDGLDLTKAVRHLRPDIDVVMITGYATIESAVETMKFGAMDYVEKPFSADELAKFANKLLILRQERLEKATPPKVHLVTPISAESASPSVVNVPGGAFVTAEHTWLGVDINGEARIGLDDFAQKTLTGIEEITFPKSGQRIGKGEELFELRRGTHSLSFASPVSGTVSRVHHDLTYQLDILERSPVTEGWVCCLIPDNLSDELAGLHIGVDSIRWYEKELGRFRELVSDLAPETEPVQDPTRATEKKGGEATPEQIAALWTAFATCFLEPERKGSRMRAVLILAAIFLLCAIVPAVQAQEDIAESPETVHWSSSVGDVDFPHTLHSDDFGIECETCHHETSAVALTMPHEEYFDDFWIECGSCHGASEAPGPRACSLCHKPMPAYEGDEELSSKVVIHRSCWECHEVGRGQEASQACSMCHQRADELREQANVRVAGAASDAEAQP